MDVPEIVAETIDTDDIVGRVSLGGDDALYITPSETIRYNADGLLSDESIETYPHAVERLTVEEKRRKTTFHLDYPLDGRRSFTVPGDRTEDALTSLIAGVLYDHGVIDSGEQVIRTYRFSELSVIITSDRLVKHIGEPVWDADFEQFRYEDLTKLSFEEGSVATQIVIEIDGRQERIKAPNTHVDAVIEHLQRALFSYYDVESIEELNALVASEEDDDARPDPANAFSSDVEPLDASINTADDAAEPVQEREDGETERIISIKRTHESVEADDSTPTDGKTNAAEPAEATDPPETANDDDIVTRIQSLERTIERQRDLLEEQQAILEDLVNVIENRT